MNEKLIKLLTALVRDHYVGVMDQCKTRLEVNRLTRVVDQVLIRLGASPDDIVPEIRALDAERVALAHKLEEMEQVLSNHDHTDAYKEISKLLEQITEQDGSGD